MANKFERDVVHHPGAVVVVPLTASRTVVMVRQFRAAVDAELLELPAGKRDVRGEPTEITAARELAEEIGRRAGRLDLLARFYNSPGFSDEFSWLYLAQDLSVAPLDRQGAEERHMAIEEVPLAAALRPDRRPARSSTPSPSSASPWPPNGWPRSPVQDLPEPGSDGRHRALSRGGGRTARQSGAPG